MKRLIWLLVLVPVLGGCSSAPGSQGLGYATADGTVRVIPADARKGPIALSGVGLDGNPLELPARSTRATVLNIWWSGCACRVEAPALRDLAADPGRIADFYGINVRESGREQAKRFEDRYRIPYPSFYDPGGGLLLGLNGAVPYAAIPTTLILDREMRIGAVILGAIPTGSTFTELIAAVVTPEQ